MNFTKAISALQNGGKLRRPTMNAGDFLQIGPKPPSINGIPGNLKTHPDNDFVAMVMTIADRMPIEGHPPSTRIFAYNFTQLDIFADDWEETT